MLEEVLTMVKKEQSIDKLTIAYNPVEEKKKRQQDIVPLASYITVELVGPGTLAVAGCYCGPLYSTDEVHTINDLVRLMFENNVSKVEIPLTQKAEIGFGADLEEHITGSEIVSPREVIGECIKMGGMQDKKMRPYLEKAMKLYKP
jgi:hypothetical protein